MKCTVFLGIWLALLLLRVDTLQGQSYTMTDGQTITTCSGNFYDPGGQSGDYNNSLDYTQTFKTSSPYLCLMITFTSFVTESGFDKLYVYDGGSSSGTLLGTYSGTLSPFSVVSSTGALTFVFHSDGSVQKPGWEATFSCEDCSLPPPIEPDYSMHHGTDTINCLEAPRPFYDPGGFGENYDNNSDYIQTFVSSDPSKCLTVTFTSFATEWYLDKLYVYDGTVAAGTILGVYSGYLDPFTVTSFTGTLTFVFHSDNVYNEEGWVAEVSCSDSCAEPPEPSNNMHYGTDTIYCSQAPRPFYDPGGPDGNYDYLSDYIQTFVSSDPDNCLQVTFTSIEIEEDWDLLYVYDGYSTTSTLVATLTGSMSNVTITSSTGALTFQFFSDNYYNDAGWVATISCSACAVPPTPPPPPDPNPCDPNGIHPFCTDENPYGITYSSGTSGDNASSFLGSTSYSCLYSTPNPAWYYMQVSEPGDLLIYIEQVNASGIGLDVDFVCWGPFTAANQSDFVSKLCTGEYSLDNISHGNHRPTNGNHQNNMGGYPDGNVVDCSYSAQSTEWCFIPNATAGEWYLLLLTNYSGQSGTITFSLVNEYSTASTNCNLLVPISYNDPLCVGDTLVLTCENPMTGATYNWSGPGGWTAVTNVPYVSIPDASTSQTGQYTLQITGSDTIVAPSQVDVTIHAIPQVTVTVSADTVCEGTSVTLQANGATNYQWSPTTGTGNSITVTPENTTTYTVIGTTNGCADTVVRQVTVLQNTTGDTSVVACSSFDWYGETLSESGPYTHTLTNAMGCDSIVTLHLTVSDLPEISITPSQDVVCEGNSLTLTATTGQGFSYLWNTGETTSIILVTPGETTAYSVTVTNGSGCKDSTSVTITVSTINEQTLYDTVCQGGAYDGYGFTLTTAETNTPGTLTLSHTDTDDYGCISTTILALTVQEAPHDTISQTACDSIVWHGITYTLSGYYTDTLQTVNGCDSLVTLDFTVGQAPDIQITTSPSPAAVCAGEEITLTAVTECFGSEMILYEGFDGLVGGSDSTMLPNGPSNTQLTLPSNQLTDAFISGVRVYPAGNAIKLGSSSNVGSITSNYLDLTQDFTVTVRAKGWLFYNNTPPKNTKIRVSTNPGNAQEIIVPGNSVFTDYTFAFSAAGNNAQVTIETVNSTGGDKRAFIDYVRITRDVPCSYSWYTATGTISSGTEITVMPSSTDWYYFSATSPLGCEGADSVEVVVDNPEHQAYTTTQCESYTWNGTTYTESGHYTYEHEDANGCLQVDTLHLTIDNYAAGTDVQTACGSFPWIDGNTYTESNHTATYTIAGGAANGCDSVVTLNLTVYHPVASTSSVTECGSYTWTEGNGETYTTSGLHTYAHEDANGCLQVDTLHLTIHNPVHTSVTETACEFYTWHGTTYTESGHYTYEHEDANGCLQVDTLHLTIHNPTHTAVTVTACDSYMWENGNGQTYTSSDDYLYPHEDANGCLQVDTLHLTITGSETIELYETRCENYEWYDGATLMEIYTSSGVYTKSFTNAAGCDSVVTLHLTILTPAYTEETVTECVSYTWNGTTYTISGDYDWTGTGVNGCDSTATLHLTISNPVSELVEATSCDSYTWTEGNGQTYTTSGDYTYAHENEYGCLQVDTLHLTITGSEPTEIYATVCENYEWYDGDILMEIYTSSGVYTKNFTNTAGCDSVVTLYLTVNSITISEDTITECVSYTWNGTTYDTSGIYDWTGMGANGCDSAAILYLTILHPEHQSFTETAYDSYTWTTGDGNTYVQTGTYIYEHCDTNGCTQNDTLNLTIYYSSENVFAVTACESYEWDGEIYTQSGTYVRQYFDIHYADSTVTLHLIVNHGTHNVDTIIACNSYEWHGQTYDTSGTYTYAYTNSVGCPSVDTLYLTVITTPAVTISGPQLFCPDSSVTLTAVTETPPESYLWSNGATTASITVSDAGIYAVTAYYAGGCSAVSADFHVFETENPIVDGFLNDMVAGDTQTVVIGTVADDNLQYLLPQSTLTYSTVTFLPDGVSCDPTGCSYRANLTFSGFPDSAVIQSAEDVRYMRLNMEHSSICDLYINLTCPEGLKADILKKNTYGSSTSPCLPSTGSSHFGWNHDVYDVVSAYQAQYPFRKTFLGSPLQGINADYPTNPCDTTNGHNQQGAGWNYCWSNNTIEGYQYAPGMGSLMYDTANAHFYNVAPLNRIIDSSDVSNGQNFYHPDESFSNLAGCSVNGTWYIEVIDGVQTDNGYIFEAELSLAEYMSDTHYAHITENELDGQWVTRTGDSTFVITPPEDLTNDTVVGYTFTLIDDNGCTFDTIIYIHVYAHKHVHLYDTVNASELPHVWEGLTFNGAGCQDTLLHTVHGADSLVTLHLSVIYHYDTTICANKTPIFWHNQTFYSTSSVTVSQSVESGCADSIEVLMVKVNPVFRDTVQQAVCENELPFLWHDNIWCNAEGNYYDSLVSVVTDCDSIYVLQLTVYPGTHDVFDTVVCENYEWHGTEYDSSGTYTFAYTNFNGCASVDTLHLTVNYGTHLVFDTTVCESYEWHGQTYDTSGTYTYAYTNSDDCASVDTLHLTVHYGTHLVFDTTVCENYEWHGQTYDTSGTYTHAYTDSNGCASVDTLHLTVNYGTHDVEPVTACESYTWHEQTYTASGTYTYAYTNGHGCPSVDTLKLIINSGTHNAEPVTACESYTWHGHTYDTSGTYTYDYSNAFGCLSTDTLHLTVHYGTHLVIDTSACEIFEWHGQTIIDSGMYYHEYMNDDNCPSVDTLRLTIHHSTNNEFDMVACESYEWHGQTYDSSGTYTYEYENEGGCESVDVLHLTVHYGTHLVFDTTVCESYEWHGQTYDTSGTYTYAYTNSDDCASVDTLHLTVHYGTHLVFDTTVCENYEWHGQTYDTSGTYTYAYTDSNGCASVDTLHLTVNYGTHDVEPVTACESYTWHEQTYTASGTYTYAYTNGHGCPSVDTLKLIINSGTHNAEPVTACESYTWHGQTYDTSGTYTYDYSNAFGCLSTDTLHLTVHYGTHLVIDTSACEIFEWHGQTIIDSGMYYHEYVNDDNCPSVDTLRLTIHHSTNNEFDMVACESYEWHGQTYDTSGTYTYEYENEGGCESVDILHLTIHYSVERADTLSICVGELPYVYGDTLFEVGTLSGNYVLYDTTIYGCDSTVSLLLQVKPNLYISRAATICESMLPALWEEHLWMAGGTIIDTFPASNGCDSIVTKTLTVGVTTDTTIVDTVVENQLPYILNGKVYTAPGIYHDTTMNMAACDSIITLDLTVFYNVTTTLDSTICDNLLPLFWNGVLFGEADTQSVVLTAATGADSTVVMRLHVNETPQVSISGPIVFCLGDSIELTAVSTPVTAYLWSTGDTSQSLTIHTAGTYTVTVTNEYACTATDSLNVSESFIVNPIAAHPLPDMCAGEEYLFEIPGLISTALSVTVDGLWVTAASDTSFLFSPPDTLASGTAVAYTFHFLNEYGCSYDTTVYSNVYSQSQTVIDTTVCNSFVWNGVTYTQSDTITLHTPNIHGCDSVVTVHLVVNHSSVSYDTLYLVENQLPYYFEPSDTLFAVGSPAAFQFSYAIPIQGECDSTIIEQVYVYMNYFQAFDTLVCSSALPLTWHGHTFTGAGTVTDALLTVHGSDSILVYTVNVDALSATIGSVTHINCYGESTGAATATVTGGVTPLAYQWTNASGSMVSVTTQISNRPAGDYTFTVTDGAGCTATQTVTLNTLHGQMQPGTISGPGALCYGETLGTVSGTAATGDDCVYQWQISGNGTSWSPATGINNAQDYTSTEVFSEAFMLRRAWISGACGTLYSNILTINVWPVSSDTIHDAICAGEPYQQHGFNIPATETVGQTGLTVVDSLTNSYGCDSLVTLMLDIYPTQETVIQTEVCEGDGYHLDGFSVSASETVGADTLLRILNYQTVEGCDSVVRLEVSVIDTALRIESLTDDFCDEMMAELVVVTNLPDYEWSTGEQLPNITVIAPGVYNVTASQGGCSVTAKYVVEPCVIELYLPNAISPSREDGLNDYFGISEYAQRIINMFEISIFNRWGEMVFHSTDKGFRWNGEYRGQIYHQNVYNYVIHYTDSAGRPFRVTGIVTVL